jgi:hypothetical protein
MCSTPCVVYSGDRALATFSVVTAARSQLSVHEPLAGAAALATTIGPVDAGEADGEEEEKFPAMDDAQLLAMLNDDDEGAAGPCRRRVRPGR